jgi:hypothetical protein
MLTKINWLRFLDYNYWLEGIKNGTGSLFVTPAVKTNSDFYWFFIIFFCVLAIIGILSRFLQLFLNKNHPLQVRIPFFANNITWLGVVGIGWFILRQIEVAFLGARFWLIFLLAWGLAIVYISVKYMLNFYKLELAYFKKTGSSPVIKKDE